MTKPTFYRLITHDGYWAIVGVNKLPYNNFIKTIYDNKQKPHEVIGAIIVSNFNANIDQWYGWDNSEEEIYTLEVCPHCQNERWIWANKPSICRDCFKPIFPCTTCYNYLPGYKDCDWTEKNWCWRFPKEKTHDGKQK